MTNKYYGNNCLGDAILDELALAPRFAAWMAETIDPWLGARILEIGSGNGNISHFLPVRDRLTLSDNAPEALDRLARQFAGKTHIDVRAIDLNRDADFASFAGQYDSVVCLNVLEHIEDDAAAIRRMQAALAPRGALILLVPQYPWLMSRLDRALGHYRRYTRRDLIEKIASAGLSNIHAFSFNALGLAGWAVNNRLLGRTTLGHSALRCFDRLVPMMRFVEKRLAHPGLSLVAVGRTADQSANTGSASCF